tara:strand:+ start:82470 stop:82787 length:318 start_codon:yes stop_codon:yes gene_type:complete
MKIKDSYSLLEKSNGSAAPKAVPFAGQVVEEALDSDLIADLSNEQIQRMTDEEMQRVIKASRLNFTDSGCIQRLAWFNRDTLRRLVYLARFSCQNERCRKDRLQY